MATLRLLEILRDLPDPPKFLYASSSEVFGSPPHSPQDELTPLNPTTPYGAAKAFSQQMARIYRIAYGLQACAVILYNHESPRRNSNFVSMKIARAAARIKKGIQSELILGSLEGRRDWGWAPDYVRGMWSMLQQDKVDDFVLATGQLHRVADLVACAFEHVELNWQDFVRYDAGLVSSVEPVAPCGNPAKANRVLGWQNSVPFKEMVALLVDSELKKLT
jgi:GDPmannose 4,6-dehydratase